MTPAIAKKYQTYADAISGAPAYEKTNAFRLFARSVAGMIEPVDFPRAEASDRLRDKAQALGLLMNQTEDDIQREIAEAFDNPIPDDGTVGELMAPAKQSNQSVHKLVTYRLSEVDPEPVTWLWPGRIAIGKLTLIAGEPGLGKSQLLTTIAAATTTGGTWPNREGHALPGNVIILSAEDGLADTIVPRMIAAGANRERVHVGSAVQDSGAKGRRTFNMQADLLLLENKIEEIGDVRLVGIDPISSYMGGKIDTHKNTDVRGVLEAVSEMAARHHVAMLGITHFSKGIGQKAINAFIGSIAFVAAARAAFAVMKDPDDEQLRLFLPVKNNLAPLGH